MSVLLYLDSHKLDEAKYIWESVFFIRSLKVGRCPYMSGSINLWGPAINQDHLRSKDSVYIWATSSVIYTKVRRKLWGFACLPSLSLPSHRSCCSGIPFLLLDPTSLGLQSILKTRQDIQFCELDSYLIFGLYFLLYFVLKIDTLKTIVYSNYCSPIHNSSLVLLTSLWSKSTPFLSLISI